MKYSCSTSSLAMILASALVSPCGCSLPTTRTAEVVDPFLGKPAVAASMAIESSGDAESLPEVQLVAYEATAAEPLTIHSADALTDQSAEQTESAAAESLGETLLQPPAVAGADPAGPPSLVPQPAAGGVYPIDLANALRLGGADNLQIRLARTRLFQAQARHFAAKSLWVPSLRFGIGYNKHDGRLQQTEGNVLEINRNSTFVGGGLGLGQAPLAAGAAGPPRMFVNLSLADAAFAPLAACQEVAAHGAAERAAQNDALAEIAVAYYVLVEAQGRLANARFAESLGDRLVAQVSTFEREGFSSQTEVSRARAATAVARRRAADAERQAVAASADLARILRLPPQVQLIPAEDTPLPIQLVDPAADVDFLIAQALGNRPELAQISAQREAACWRVKHEQWRPWIPHVQVGASGGEFGGAPGSTYLNAGSRSDVDLIAVWEWRNLGLGNVALQRQRRGELHQRVLELEQQREQIAAEVVAAAADVASFGDQVDITRSAIGDAQESYRLNELRVLDGEGLPIELLQSIVALANAQDAYNEAVASYNQAQYRLMRALGTPAGPPAEAIVAAELR